MSSIKNLRHRLEVQGFTRLSDQDIQDLGPWLRFTPWANATVLAVGTISGSPRILFFLAFLMALGSALSRHPFDWLYNQTIRHLTHTKPLPPSGPQRRFVFGIMCWWLLPTAFFFYLGGHITPFNPKYFAWAFVSGCVMLAMTLMLAMGDICVISELMNWISVKRDKRTKK
jgi:hypothetical protein